MRAVISAKARSEFYKSFDRIHEPAIYDVGIKDEPWIAVDHFQPDFSQEEALITPAQPNPADSERPWTPPLMHNQARNTLKKEIKKSHALLCKTIENTGSKIIARTKAHNRKCAEKTIEQEQAFRADILGEQIKIWRELLPGLLKKFSKIKDPRREKSIEHKLVTLMLFGLFAFVFKLQSRREMNRELTAATINSNLKKIFPDLETIPHADTLARVLARINPLEIEKIQVGLIRELIENGKFKKLLINGRLPISIDGTQKMCRDGLLQDGHWCERKVGKDVKQQYVYTVEANITFKNGLTIPLMSEHLYRDNHQLTNPTEKGDCELMAFDRMAERLKRYFPNLKIILLMDSLYATQTVMELCNKNHWDFMISLPADKLKKLSGILKSKEDLRKSIPGQTHYRGRSQEFHWENSVVYGDMLHLKINLLGCLEKYELVNNKTGEIEAHHSKHSWISSLPFSIFNVHELCNLCARKKELIEDSFNTEKNRGYQYEHAFSYGWIAMQGFHYLMRLAHAINAFSEFTKKLKRFIKEHGCSATLKLIKETLFSPWLSVEWYRFQGSRELKFCLQLE